MLAGCGGQSDLAAGGSALSAGDLSPAAAAATPVGRRLAAGPGLTIGGEALDGALLRQFYARHGFQPVWPRHPAQAAALREAVLSAGDQGLEPSLFHAELLRRQAMLAPLDRELLLSDAVLTYAHALARGAVPVDRRGPGEFLTPQPIDVTLVLDKALASPHPARTIDALAPTTPTYLGLRQALQAYRGLSATPHDRLRKIVVNMERERWLPRPLPADRVWVNVADERLVFYRAGQPVFKTRVVVGQDVTINQSPEFQATINSVFYDPPWVIPRDIVAREILPAIRRNANYLEKNDMVALSNGEVEQLPGPDAGLGLLMLDMPNRFDVYLHDTPNHQIFNLADRRISHGCIRVQGVTRLAALLLQVPQEEVDQGITLDKTTRHFLPSPMPVIIGYETAFVDTDGSLQYRPDFYHRDEAIWKALHRGARV
ncbi:hypothetical protein AcidC75_22040 [Acidisoma sp. C75]